MKENQSYVKNNVAAEIVNIIKRSNKRGGSLLWQNLDGQKKAYSIQKLELNPPIKTLFLYLNEKIQVDESKAFFIKLSHRETIFKAKFLACAEQILSVEIPKELMTRELRKEARQKFKMSDKKTVTLSYEINLIKSSWQNIDYQLLDVSLGGFSLLCNEKMSMLLSQVTSFYVDAFDSKKIKEPMEVSFVYSKMGKYKIRGKIMTQNRVGFKFKKKLTPQVLETILTSSSAQ